VHYGNLILDLSPLYFAELQENGSSIEDERRTEEEFLSFMIDSGMYVIYIQHPFDTYSGHNRMQGA